MATYKLLLLPGDGIGPEVIGEVDKLIAWFRKRGIAGFETETDLVGGEFFQAEQVPAGPAEGGSGCVCHANAGL